MERNIVFIAFFATLIAVLGLIPKIAIIPAVPITAQSMGVMLCGTILGSKKGALAALLFVILVAIGFPLLSGGRGGLALFVSPSVGFLIGFPVAAFVTGFIVERWRGAPLMMVSIVASIIGSIGALYLMGITGMAIFLEKTWFDAAALALVFVPGDLVKVILTGFMTVWLAKARPQSLLSRS